MGNAVRCIMKSLINLIIILFSLSVTNTILGQEIIKTDESNVFQWSDVVCTYKGKFDTSRYNKSQLEGTFRLCFFYGFQTSTFANDVNMIDRLDVYALDNEYKELSEFLDTLTIVDHEYFKKIKRLRLQELKETYRFSRIRMQAYVYPEILLNEMYDEDCSKYAEILNGNSEQILQSWKNMFEEKFKGHPNAEKLRKSFMQKYNSFHGIIYGRIYLVNYGWWNCINKSIRHVNSEEQPYLKFRQLFNELTQENCDD